MKKLIYKLINLGDSKKKRDYISDVDLFLHKFDKDQPRRSLSQKKEVAKHRDIYTKKAAQRIKW
ncbi:hypothetical protein L3V86_03835 [Thiotrichales bacterium 19S11-10]|nr:hypothetical protein [Thiotrichales bacterium 19S11-10]MCF6806847.1 hypothetical protein [Thiotrichales bacterium 19S9-11]MCF6810816.1 hypothetical protein [Thiotrichales bacterium 19S9-12]